MQPYAYCGMLPAHRCVHVLRTCFSRPLDSSFYSPYALCGYMALSDGCGEGWPCTSQLLTQHRFCVGIRYREWCLLIRFIFLRLMSLLSVSLSRKWALVACLPCLRPSYSGFMARWTMSVERYVLDDCSACWVLTCPERLAEVEHG